ncbi:MAG: hypothetical protein ACSHW0_07270 [Thalassotalea sp.]
MVNLRCCLIFCLFFNSYFASAQSPATSPNLYTIDVAVVNISYIKYSHLLKQDFCQHLPDYKQQQIDRTILEVTLMCMAFNNQGANLAINFIISPNYNRSIWMIKEAKVHTAATSIWSQDIHPDDPVYNTIDVIRKGEFEKGIYVRPEHPLLTLQPQNVDLTTYTGITFKNWVHDWQLILQLSDNKVYDGYLPTLFKMLKNKRADYTLIEFPSNQHLAVRQQGIDLYPVMGVKVAIPDSRKLVIAKNAKDSAEIFSILNQGLKTMRANNEIYRVYADAGFFNQQTKNWRVINSIN